MRIPSPSLILIAFASLLPACRQLPSDRSAEAAVAIRAADAAWEKAFSSQQLDAAVAAVEPTGSVMAPNAPIATGREAVRTLFQAFFAITNLNIHWKPSRTEGAQSGDLGFSTGTYEMTFAGPAGRPDSDRGKYVTVWRRQEDGSWKVVLDIFNSDLPPRAQ